MPADASPEISTMVPRRIDEEPDRRGDVAAVDAVQGLGHVVEFDVRRPPDGVAR